MANRRIYFVVSTPFAPNHVSGPTRTPSSLSLSRSIASARHNITILYSLTIGSQPSVSWSDLSSAFLLLLRSSFFTIPSQFITKPRAFPARVERSSWLQPLVHSSRPLSNAPSFRIHKDGGFRGSSLNIRRIRRGLPLDDPEQSSSTNYREI